MLANDTDPDGGPKTIDSVTEPAHGTVDDHRRRHRAHLPARRRLPQPAGQTDDFTYTLTPGGSTATVAITVDCSTPPTAVDDTKTVAEDSGASAIDVLANDTDPDGGDKTIASTTQPANGTVAIATDSLSLTYTPNADYCNGGSPTDDFTYTLNGGSTATVAVTVTCVDDNPTAVNDTPTVAEDSGATPIDVLANDTDPDGGTKTIASVTQPANGTVVIASDSSRPHLHPDRQLLQHRPHPTDDFTYTLNGGSTATVAVTVTCVRRSPGRGRRHRRRSPRTPAPTRSTCLANDTDTDGGPKTIASVTQPANGTRGDHRQRHRAHLQPEPELLQ